MVTCSISELLKNVFFFESDIMKEIIYDEFKFILEKNCRLFSYRFISSDNNYININEIERSTVSTVHIMLHMYIVSIMHSTFKNIIGMLYYYEVL